MFHTSQPDRVPGGRVDENLARQFEMPNRLDGTVKVDECERDSNTHCQR